MCAGIHLDPVFTSPAMPCAVHWTGSRLHQPGDQLDGAGAFPLRESGHLPDDALKPLPVFRLPPAEVKQHFQNRRLRSIR